METNGINVSEMNMLLLKKVEELTLHLIELKKENDATRCENAELRTAIEQIKSHLEKK
jgi:regulator of replication initiation timing